jgi:hypothetical protein
MLLAVLGRTVGSVSPSVWILVGTDPVAVRVLIASVVVVVIPIGSHCGRADGSAVSRATVAISRIASGITSDRTAGTTRNGVAWTARTTGDWMARAGTSCVVASAAAMNSPGVHPATVKASAAHAAATAAAHPGIGIIGNERGREKNDGRNESKKITKHDVSSLDIGIAVMRLSIVPRELRPAPNMALRAAVSLV